MTRAFQVRGQTETFPLAGMKSLFHADSSFRSIIDRVRISMFLRILSSLAEPNC